MKRQEIVITGALIAGLAGFFLLLPQPPPIAQESEAPPAVLFVGVRLFDGERVHGEFDLAIDQVRIR